MKTNIFWFRRDLRLQDNSGLYQALRQGMPVQAVFFFDRCILYQLENKRDNRVQYIHNAITALQKELLETGASLHVLYGTPVECFQQLCNEYDILSVYTNHDYEPYAITRDREIATLFLEKGITFLSFKDQVIFEKNEIIKSDGTPYTIFTPYSRKWLEKLSDDCLAPFPSSDYLKNFRRGTHLKIPKLSEIGFEEMEMDEVKPRFDNDIISKYETTRDFPAISGTTRMSVHLRFGTISIRDFAYHVRKLNQKLLMELIWRDFYHSILWHFPNVQHSSFKKEYDRIQWRNNENEFAAWCSGVTGYPIVDAGMRELNETGYMHNRVRMITASFLTKHLLIDWRWGEAYFAEKLLDYDLAANNGGWQWAAGCGCDAAPYFRIFNPYVQTEKFDPALTYIRKWIPEIDTASYPKPVVDHSFARNRCLEAYKKALNP